MSSQRLVRGTHDILDAQMSHFQKVKRALIAHAGSYNFQEVSTPILEHVQVFMHTLGETSDIVTKEMFQLHDKKSGEVSDIVLRPEGTAGIMRAILTNGLTQSLPLKYYYMGPMFRYERPQKGRLRQFHQIGVEYVGEPSFYSDIEVISLGFEILKSLGLEDKIQLEVNTLGDSQSRKVYRDALVKYFKAHENKLSYDSKERLEKNPLRILDSKDEGDRALLSEAPLYSEYLNEESKDFYKRVLEGLDKLSIPYVNNPQLVRGLDYYCHTAFEFTTTELGTQGAVMAGGRYDNLSKIMGGPELPGVGWAAGIERLAMLLGEEQEKHTVFAFVPIGEQAEAALFALMQEARKKGIACEMTYKGNMKARMKRADKISARAAIIAGDDELNNNQVTLKDLESGEQQQVSIESLFEVLASF